MSHQLQKQHLSAALYIVFYWLFPALKYDFLHCTYVKAHETDFMLKVRTVPILYTSILSHIMGFTMYLRTNRVKGFLVR